MDCTKCNHEMSWVRMEIWHRKIYYCKTCGYNFKRTFRGKIIEDPLYAIGMISKYKQPVLFYSKKSFTAFLDNFDDIVFIPLKNSTNIKKEHDDKVRKQTR